MDTNPAAREGHAEVLSKPQRQSGPLGAVATRCSAYYSRAWRVALCLIVACSLFGCKMSHVEAAKEMVDSDEQPIDGEPDDQPQGPEGPEGPEPEPGPALSIADVSAAEHDGTLNFRVSLSRAAGAAVSVQYATEDGTATAGTDYQATSGTLRFPSGSAAALPIQVIVNDDAVAEAAETVVVRLSNAQEATVAVATATGTITDDDTRALVVRPRQLTVVEGLSARYEVVLGSRPTGQVTVVLDDGPELAVEPDELVFGPGTWQVSQQVTVTAEQDEDSSADDPVLLRIAARGGGYDEVQESVRVTIAEDDTTTLAVSGSRATERSGRMQFEIALIAASSAEVTVSYATGSQDDSATAGEDYGAKSGTASFTAGSARVRTIDVAVYDDTKDEPDEEVTITLNNVRNAVLIGGGTTLTAVGVIEDDDERPQVRIGDSSAAEDAPQGEMRFTVTLEPESGRVVTVRYATGNVTATSGIDYTSVRGTLTFAPGVGEQTIAVPIANDTLDEDDEDFTVTLNSAVNATLNTGYRTATGTVTDDDAPSGLSIADARAQEAAGYLRFPVTLDRASGLRVTVGYTTADGTAAAGSDYATTGGTMTFSAGTRARTIEVPVTDDSLQELDENLTVTLQTPSNAILVDASATGTIEDDDGTPGLSIADARAQEAAGNLRFPVTLDRASGLRVTVGYTTADGTAAAGSDYTATNGTMTFSTGTLTRTIEVPVTDDSAEELDENLTVTLQTPSNATLDDASATGTIEDDDAPSGLSIADARAQEAAGYLRFPVTLDHASGLRVTVGYTTADGTATAGSDYTTTGGTLTFSAGTRARTIEVPVTDDSLEEMDKDLTVTLQTPSNAILVDASATGTIEDDDGTPGLSIADARAQEAAGYLRFPVTLDYASGLRVTVGYTTADGTATAGSDYTTTGGTLTFSAGTRARTIEVPVTDDSVEELEEDFTVTLQTPSNATLDDASATGTIEDDDVPGLSIADARAQEAAGYLRFPVTLDRASGLRVTVGYTTADGTATAGSDYTTTGGRMTFSAGTRERTIEVPVTDDSVEELEEDFTVTLQTPSNATLDDASATGTIEDDDVPGLSIADARAQEADGNLRFPVTLDRPSGLRVTVGYTTADGTATAGSDYTTTGGTLTFSTGTRERTIAVPVTDDSVEELEEDFTVTLQTPSNATLDDASATGTIEDDDVPGLSIADARAQEADGYLRFPVTLDRASGLRVTVGYTTADGTATAGNDYTTTAGTVTFAAGTRERTIAVPVTDDSVEELDENLTVTLQTPSNATLDDASATGTIEDDDVPGLSIADARAQEADGNLRFPVTLDRASGLRVTVGYTTADGTATAGSDYTTTGGTMTFSTGTRERTIEVPVTDDSLQELDENLTVTLQTPSNATLDDASATGTIEDDDGPEDDHGDTQQTATTVVPATMTTPQEPIAGHLETEGDIDYFRVVADAGETVGAILNPSTQHGNYVYAARIRIESASYTSSNVDGYDAAALSSSTTVYVRVWSKRGTTRYNLGIWIRDRNNPADTSFDIGLIYSSTTKPTTSQQSTIRAAADKWEDVITRGLPARFVARPNMCLDSDSFEFGTFVDDLHIDIRVKAIDGAGGIWASAGTCTLRTDEASKLPYTSKITFDSADIGRLSSANLRILVLHEIAHALGFGTLGKWDSRLVNSAVAYRKENPTSTTLPDTHFPGTAAVSAFNAIASSYTGGKVPVENDTQSYGDGSLDGHWRESVFGTEVMDTVVSSGSERLSRVTIAAIADLGYSVNYSEAESFTLSSSSLDRPYVPRTAFPTLLDIRDEVLREPEGGSGLPEQDIPVIR